MIGIVIPCKGFGAGKLRLAPCLDPEARTRLCRTLLERTLAVAGGLPGAVATVVSDNADVLALSRRSGIRTMQDRGQGLNAALHAANREAVGGAWALLVLPIDLPFATAEALDALCAAPGEVAIAPDRAGSGTNVMRLDAAARVAFPFAYGPGSFGRHASWARAQGRSVSVLEDERLQFDLDEPGDYAAWCGAEEKGRCP